MRHVRTSRGGDSLFVYDQQRLTVFGPNGTFVYVVQPDSTVTVVPVAVSLQDDEQAVITRGLEADQQVVTTGFVQLADGKRVRVSDGTAPPAFAPPPGLRPGARRNRGGGERRQQASGTRPSASP